MELSEVLKQRRALVIGTVLIVGGALAGVMLVTPDITNEGLSVSWSPNGEYVALIADTELSEQERLIIWNVDDNKAAGELKTEKHGSFAIAWSGDGTKLAVLTQEKNIEVYSLNQESFELLETYSLPSTAPVPFCSRMCWPYSSDQIWFSGGSGIALMSLNVANGNWRSFTELSLGISGGIRNMVASTDGSMIAIAIDNDPHDQVVVINSENAEESWRETMPHDLCSEFNVAWSPDSSIMAVLGGGTLALWPLNGTQPTTEWDIPSFSEGCAENVMWNTATNRIFVTTPYAPNQVTIIDPSGGDTTRSMIFDSMPELSSIKISPNGEQLCLAGPGESSWINGRQQGEVLIADVTTGEIIDELRIPISAGRYARNAISGLCAGLIVFLTSLCVWDTSLRFVTVRRSEEGVAPESDDATRSAVPYEAVVSSFGRSLLCVTSSIYFATALTIALFLAEYPLDSYVIVGIFPICVTTVVAVWFIAGLAAGIIFSKKRIEIRAAQLFVSPLKHSGGILFFPIAAIFTDEFVVYAIIGIIATVIAAAASHLVFILGFGVTKLTSGVAREPRAK